MTGGQRTAAGSLPAGSADFAALARAAGFRGESVKSFNELDAWRQEAAAALAAPGPRFIELVVEPVGAAYHLESPGPLAARLARFQQALGVGNR